MGDEEKAAVTAKTSLVVPVKARELFTVFFGISAVTIGGGYAMVPVIGRALEKRGWMGESEFLDLFAVAQSFPGPLALTTAIVAGRRLGGVAGASASFAGIVLPPFGALLAVGALLGEIGRLKFVADFLDGAGATVWGLVAAMIWKMAKNRTWKAHRVAGLAALAAALALAPRYAVPLFFGAAVIFYFVEKRWSS